MSIISPQGRFPGPVSAKIPCDCTGAAREQTLRARALEIRPARWVRASRPGL